MATFIAKGDEGYIVQGLLFCEQIDTYSALFGLPPAQVDQIKLDFEWFTYSLRAAIDYREFAQAATTFKDQLRYGTLDQPLPAFPAVPVFDPPPAVTTTADAQKRFATIIQQIVKHPSYSKVIGQNLGIEAPENPFDPQMGKPQLKTSFSSGGHPNILWKKGKFQGIEIWKDSGTGWAKLERDFSPDYTDKTALPPVGQTAVWKYKAIYLYKDDVVGNWSDEVSVTVFGNV